MGMRSCDAIRDSRAALLVVDMSRGLTERASPLACEADGAIAAVDQLLAAAREQGVPVFYTTVAYTPEDHVTAAAFLAKAPALRMLEAGSRWAEIDPRVAPRDDEFVLRQLFPSAFAGTSLARRLHRHGVNTLIVTGASTSGCVRATVLDALQHGFWPLVPRPAVADRDDTAARQALAEIDLKYGDVISLDAAREQLAVQQSRA